MIDINRTDIEREWFRLDFEGWHRRQPSGDESAWHWCPDWDMLPLDAACPEFECCTCKRGDD